MKFDIKNILRNVYHSTPFTWRVAKDYYKTLDYILSASYNPKDVEKWQLCKLQQLVKYVYQNTEGYRILYDEVGIKPADIQSLEDLKLLPFTNKELIRDNIEEFTVRKQQSDKLSYITTSGSSGIPFGFYMGTKEHWNEEAFVSQAWNMAGWDISQSGIILRGSYVGDKDHIFSKCENNDFYAHNDSYRVSPYFLTQDNYNLYREFLLVHKNLAYVFAYPSSITLLANLIISNNDIGKFSIHSILLGSENLYSWQLNSIINAFPNSKIISCYGMTERTIFASWCKDSQCYHVHPYYGITELLDVNNNPVVRKGDLGELIGTAFWCNATPFIRYRTNDFAIKGDSECLKCGFHGLMLDRIDGRLNESVVSNTGRLVSMVSINMHDHTFDGVAKFRFVQKEKGILTLQIQPMESFSIINSIDKIKKSIMIKLGDDFEVSLEIVKDIRPSKSGKYSFLEQHIKIDTNDRLIY